MSWVNVAEDSHFPIQNLPYGVFATKNDNKARVGVAIGDYILDLSVLVDEGFFKDSSIKNSKCFHQESLNEFMSLGRPVWKEVRAIIQNLLSKDTPTLRDNSTVRAKALIPQSEAQMQLPAQIRDYTDFYASKEHASNIGTMWRGKDNALMPNWLHIPIGYHGRASSIVVSGTPVRRPRGQTVTSPQGPPSFTECKVLDFELEMVTLLVQFHSNPIKAFLVGPPSKLGDPIRIENAEDHIFGLVLMNDWSARDIQKWEYQPLGPFCAKNWATTISPWVVTLEALEPFRVAGPEQDPVPLPYLRDKVPGSYDINLSAAIKTEKMKEPHVLSNTNFKYMYWSMKQQLVHHSITGCNMSTGDLLGSGTISGPTKDSFGSLVEITWGGRDAISFPETNEERKYLQDGDTVILSGYCQGQGYRVGFGECSGKILPAHTYEY